MTLTYVMLLGIGSNHFNTRYGAFDNAMMRVPSIRIGILCGFTHVTCLSIYWMSRCLVLKATRYQRVLNLLSFVRWRHSCGIWTKWITTNHPRASGVAAADYVNISSSPVSTTG